MLNNYDERSNKLVSISFTGTPDFSMDEHIAMPIEYVPNGVAFQILIVISKLSDKSPTNLAAALQKSTPHIQRELKKLLDAGFVHKIPNGRKNVKYVLSEKGLLFVEKRRDVRKYKTLSQFVDSLLKEPGGKPFIPTVGAIIGILSLINY